MAIVKETGTQSATGSTGTSVTITKPTGTASGDVLVAVIGIRSPQFQTLTMPANWVKIGENLGTNRGGWICYLVAGGGEPANYQFSWGAGGGNFGACIIRFSGVNNTTPSDVAASTNVSSAPDTSGIGLSITTATDGAMLVMAAFANSGTTTFTADATLIEEFDNGVNESVEAAYGIQASNGASGNKTATLSASKDWATILWAMRPAAAASTGPAYQDKLGGKGRIGTGLTD